jgi:hypothetical protein
MTEPNDTTPKTKLEQQLFDTLAKTVEVQAALAAALTEKTALVETQRGQLAERDRRIEDFEHMVVHLRRSLNESFRPPTFGSTMAGTPATPNTNISFSFAPGSAQKKRKETNDGPPFYGKAGPVVGHFGIGLPGELGLHNTVRGTDGVFR